MSVALKRKPLERFVPHHGKLETVRNQLDADDLLIAWVETEGALQAVAINKQSEQFWTVADRAPVLQQIAQLLNEIGLQGKPLRSSQEAKLAYTKTAAALSKTLFPPAIQKTIQNADRLFVIPSGNLWYLPFELLPESDADSTTPLLSRHAVCYVPTIGLLAATTGAAPAVAETVGIVGNMFSADRVSNQAETEWLLKAVPNSHRIDLSQKLAISSPTWLRIRADQIWVAASIPMSKNPWDSRLFPLDASRETLLSTWLQMPLKSPSRVFELGMHSAAEMAQFDGGNEIFLPACVLMASGTRAALLTRWPVGGKSSRMALGRLLEELQFEAPSTAWQRSAIALWAEQLASADEPALPPAWKNETTTLGGDHPLFWSSYILVGDHHAPSQP